MKEIRIFDFDGTVFSKNALSLLVQVKYHSTNIVAFGLWYIFTLFRLPIFLYLYKKMPTYLISICINSIKG